MPRAAALVAALSAAVVGGTLLATTLASRGVANPGVAGGMAGLGWLYLGAATYLVAFVVHPWFARTPTLAGSLLVGAAFGAGALVAFVVAEALAGKPPRVRDAGDLGESAAYALAVLVAHGALALPLAALARRGRARDDVPRPQAAPLSIPGLVLVSLALALGATGALTLVLLASGLSGTRPVDWVVAGSPYALVLAGGTHALRARLVPRRSAWILGASYGLWLALAFGAWFALEARPDEFEELRLPLLVALVAPAACAGLAALSLRSARSTGA